MGASMVPGPLVFDDVSIQPWSSRPSEPPKLSPSTSTQVTLHVYSVTQSLGIKTANSVLRALGMGGAFHAGVEVYGLEWSYECVNGVVCCWPGGAHEHLYLEPIFMGMTHTSYSAVLELITQFREGHWKGTEYDGLEHNCCHFSDELCRRLGVGTLPDWILNLATKGTVLRAQARHACKPCCQAIAPEGNVNFEPAERHVVAPNSGETRESSASDSFDAAPGCALFGRKVPNSS